jgi:hypothetical protein
MVMNKQGGEKSHENYTHIYKYYAHMHTHVRIQTIQYKYLGCSVFKMLSKCFIRDQFSNKSNLHIIPDLFLFKILIFDLVLEIALVLFPILLLSRH